MAGKSPPTRKKRAPGSAPGPRRPATTPSEPSAPVRGTSAAPFVKDQCGPCAADPNLAKQVSHALFELHVSRTADAQKMMDEFGLAPTQMRLLALMDPEREMTMSAAAQAAFCEPSNLTGVVDKLEAKGLLQRSLLATDRRVKMISMTSAGRATRMRLYARMHEPAPWMLALSQGEQEQLLALLRKGLAFIEASTGQGTKN